MLIILNPDMRVILLKKVEKLGLAGDVCTVSDGHARNFLFPRKFAVAATPQGLADAQRLRAAREQAATRDLQDTEAVARTLDGFELAIEEKANDQSTLFAAVTKAKISAALKKKGFVILEKSIRLATPLKEVGEHEVVLELPHGLEAMIRVIVSAI